MKNLEHEILLIFHQLVHQTFLGSIKLLDYTKKEASELADTIAIKGGTTEAGLKIMKKKKINNIFFNTLSSAYKRAKILGKK